VGHAVLELTSRSPDLVVSGVNFGPNLGIEVTISGTVGAALEAAAFGIPALAISLEMDPAYYLEGDATADYAASRTYVHKFAQLLLKHRPPRGVDVLNVNVPLDATPETFWRLTRLSRHRYFVPLPPNRANGEGRAGYKLLENPAATELDSDILTLAVARMVSVTPISLDMTAQVDFPSLNTLLLSEMAAGTDLTQISTLLKQYPMLG
jgi:5'-nucleotidase